MINLLEVFGVEEGEVFEMRYCELGQWDKYVVENNVLFFTLDGQKKKEPTSLNTIANAEIRRLPFVPKVGERYWTVVNKHGLHEYGFIRDEYDICRLELGLCYRTKEQAEREGIPKMKALIEKWGGKFE